MALQPRPQTSRKPTNVAPPPAPCEYCLAKDMPVSACPVCEGTGVCRARFDLPPSRTLQLRRVNYAPRVGGVVGGDLLFGFAEKRTSPLWWEKYSIAEFANEWNGRSFTVTKILESAAAFELPTIPTEGEKVYHVFIGELGGQCDCAGGTYMTASRANQRAWEVGLPTSQSKGCKHLDFVDALYRAGWFDLGG